MWPNISPNTTSTMKQHPKQLHAFTALPTLPPKREMSAIHDERSNMDLLLSVSFQCSSGICGIREFPYQGGGLNEVHDVNSTL
jgi:hypothetical protein